MSDTAPALSVAIITPDRFDRIRKTLRCLSTQASCHRLELLVVAPSVDQLGPEPAELSAFHSYKLIAVGALTSTGAPRIDAILAASAPIIAFSEDHCFPEPGWAEALIAAFESPHAAVGATLLNANPDTAISWASCLLNFGPAIMHSSNFDSPFIPWHNTAYRTALLRRYPREELAHLFEAEGLLHADLLGEGFTLHLCGRARAAHVNVSRFGSLCGEQFYGTRLFWHNRAQREAWPWWKRGMFVVASPGLGVLRLTRAVTEARRVGVVRRLPGMLPYLATGITLITLGAATGMLSGLGQTMPYRLSTEFFKILHVDAHERASLFQ